MSIDILANQIYAARTDIINQILPDIKYQVEFDIPAQARGWKVRVTKNPQPNTGNATLDKIYRMGLMSQDPNLSEIEQKRLNRFQREVKILAGVGSRALNDRDIINAVTKNPDLLDRFSMGSIGFRQIEDTDQLIQMPEVSGVLPIVQALKTLQRDRLVEAVTDSRYAGKNITDDMKGLNEYERAVKLVEKRKKYRTYLRAADYNKLENVYNLGQTSKMTADKELMIYAADHARSLYRYIKYTFTDENTDIKKMLDILEKVQHSRSYQLSKRYLAAVASGNLQVLQIRKYVDRVYNDKKNRVISAKNIKIGKNSNTGYADMSITNGNQDNIFKQALASYLQTIQQYIVQEVQG